MTTDDSAASGTAYRFTFHGIDDDDVIPLSRYAGKALLVVNTASACGFTPQYQGLQQLWTDYAGKGLQVLGVPSNDFNQEAGSEAQIKEFCDLRFHVTFPMTGKTHVTGADAHPFYRWAAEKAGFFGRPRWNFYKYVIDRNGNFVAWFSSLTKPGNPALKHAIDQALEA